MNQFSRFKMEAIENKGQRPTFTRVSICLFWKAKHCVVMVFLETIENEQ